MRPGLTVIPSFIPLSLKVSTMTWASARVALRPFSGSTPAWAALPVASTAYQRVALRAETISPFSRAASRVITA